jgi:hypothetical protein
MKEASHSFWGRSPLRAFSGGALVIMASCRLAFALAALGALVWVYVLSVLAVCAASSFFPKRGKYFTFLFLSTFAGGLYILLLWLLSPLLGMQILFITALVPLVFSGSGILERTDTGDMLEAAVRAFSEAFALGILVVAFSLIREPLGCLSLSLPGGIQGFVKIFSFDDGNFLPVRIVSSSAGALILLGYGAGIYRRIYPEKES